MSTPLPPGFIASPDEPRSAPARRKAVPSPPAVVVHHHGVPAWLVVVLLVVAAVLALVAWEHASHPETPATEGVRVGRDLVPALADALALGFDVAAERIERGQTIHDADDALKVIFDKERKAAFARLGGPYLAKIVPSGAEPKDDAVRKAFAEAHRDIAKGLRSERMKDEG